MRAFVALGAAVVVAGLLAGAAVPRSAKGPPKLTTSEKAALKIVSVDAVGIQKLGLVVVVRFKGDIQRAIGRGNLKDAAVALMLSKPGSRRASAGLVTSGPGAVGTTLRRATAARSGVDRNGRELTFFVGGPVPSTQSITVRSFASARLGGHAKRSTASSSEDPPAIEKERWDTLNEELDADEQSVAADSRLLASADCLIVTTIQSYAAFLTKRITKSREDLLDIDKELTATIASLQKAGGRPDKAELDRIDRLVARFVIMRGEARRYEEKGVLLTELRRMSREIKKLAARQASFLKAIESLAVAAELEDAPCSINAVFSQADRTTTYSWVTDKVFAVYTWTLLRPANDPGCDNRGRLSGTGATFAWYHGDDLCNHAREDPATGHIGVVTLKLKTLGASCEASYFGTFTGTGPKGSCKAKEG